MYKKLLYFAVASLLIFAACGDNESSPSVNTDKTSGVEKKTNNDSRDKESFLFESDNLSVDCRMKNDDSATVTRKLAVDYDGYEKLAAYTETAEYDESVSFEDLNEACKAAKKNENAEVACEDNIIVTTYIVENAERTDIRKVLKEKCRDKDSED